MTALLYSLWTLLLIGLVTGLFSQLAKLSLDALIQRDIADDVRARVFSWSETILQGFWVLGGALGIAIPLEPALGFSIITVVVLGAVLVALRSRRLGTVRMRPAADGNGPASLVRPDPTRCGSGERPTTGHRAACRDVGTGPAEG